MKIQAYDNNKTFDRFTIVIGRDVYVMSHNPISLQGVCMYYGTFSDLKINTDMKLGRKVKVQDLPTEVQLKISEIRGM